MSKIKERKREGGRQTERALLNKNSGENVS